jgi:uncharacterized heparinase superfamily protein
VRPVVCVIEHLHRDHEVAEAAAAGRFTHVGESRTLGLEPDWLGADLPADEEWRIEWAKFYYGLDLAHAHRETGAARFREAWERLVASWIRQVPPDHDSSDVTARRILNWIYAWQGFGSGPLDASLGESIGAQARHVRATLTPERNHRTLELYALLLAALAVPGLDGDGGLRRFALAELDRNLTDDFRADGVHREASTHYHMVALRSFLGVRANARRFGLSLPEGFEGPLACASAFARHCHRPDGRIPALSDADTGSYPELLALADELLGPALETHASFPDGGYFVQRSGWDDGASFGVFDCGPLGDGGHGHYDLLSVELYAGGRPLVVDPGRGTYSERPPNLRRWFRGTAAHNTVCVDGLDQTPYTRTRPTGPVAQGRFLGRATASGRDTLAGEARSPSYDAVHRRRVTLLDGERWVIEDRLRAATPHRYDLRFHLAPDAQDGARVEGATVLAPGLEMRIEGAERIALEPGWVAPRYGEYVPAPVVSAVALGGRDAAFVTQVRAR